MLKAGDKGGGGGNGGQAMVGRKGIENSIPFGREGTRDTRDQDGGMTVPDLSSGSSKTL